MSEVQEKFQLIQSSLEELLKHNPQWSSQKSHDHKMESPKFSGCFPQSPVAVVMTDQAGRQLVAARHVNAGEVLFCEPALLPLVPKQSSGPACLNCLKTLPEEDFPQCGSCGAPLCHKSCGGDLHSEEECQTITKRGLKEEHNIQQKMLLIKELNTILTPLRALLRLKKYPEKQSKVGLLEVNIKTRLQMKDDFKIEKKIVSVLQQLLGEELDADNILRLCACYDTNSFDVQVSQEHPGRGRALFLITSMMNHDCVPNTQHWYDNGFIHVRAAVDIPEGAAVTLSYSEPLWGTSPRQAHLLTSKFFKCCCHRCSSPSELGTHLSSVMCRKCGSLIEPPSHKAVQDKGDNTWNCSSCSWAVPVSIMRNIIKALGATAAKVSSDNFRGLHRLCSEVSRTLGPQHYTTVLLRHRQLLALDHTTMAELGAENLCEVLELSDDLLHVAEVIAPGMSLFRGGILLKYLRCACELIAQRKREHLEMEMSAQDLLSRSEECKEIFKFQEKSFKAVSEVEKYLKELTNCKNNENSIIYNSDLLTTEYQGTDRHLWYYLFL